MPPNLMETKEENWIKNQLLENLPTNKGDGEENRKIIKYKYHQWKNLLI